MRKAMIMAVLCACLLLTGCGSRSGEKRFEDFSADVRERETLSFTATVRAEYTDSTARFTLAFEGQGEDCAIRVLEPETLSGVTLRYKNGKTVIDCGSCVVDALALSDGVTPASALPLIASAMGSGYLDSISTEGGETVFHIIPKDGVAVELWLDEEGRPVHAELIIENRTTIFCDISDWR